MTEKQKTARLANLERGRKKRLETIKEKNEAKAQGVPEEYDLSSEDSDSGRDTESDNDAFIISKKKRLPK